MECRGDRTGRSLKAPVKAGKMGATLCVVVANEVEKLVPVTLRHESHSRYRCPRRPALLLRLNQTWLKLGLKSEFKPSRVTGSLFE